MGDNSIATNGVNAMRTYYELITTYYRDGHVTSNIYPSEQDRKPAKRKFSDITYTIYREWYRTEEEAKKMQTAYLSFVVPAT